MSWTDLTFTGSHILTASDMNRLQGNFAAMAAGEAAAPPIAVNSLAVSGVASIATLYADSAYVDLDADRIVGGNFAAARIPNLSNSYQLVGHKGQPNGYAELDANGDVRDAQIPNLNASKVTSGTLNQARVPFEAPGPIGSTIPGTGKFSTIDVTSSPSGTPVANRIYKDSICKAWINFDGTAVTNSNDLTGVRDYFNVSGLVAVANGHFKIFWDRDFANTDYAVWVQGGTLSAQSTYGLKTNIAGVALGYVLVETHRTDNARVDHVYTAVLAFGDQ